MSGHFDALVVNCGKLGTGGSVHEVWSSPGIVQQTLLMKSGSRHCAAGSVDDEAWSKSLDLSQKSGNVICKNTTEVSMHLLFLLICPIHLQFPI